MIIPCYHIGPSRIPGAGRGLFVGEAIARGRVVIAPVDIQRQHLLHRNEVRRLSEAQQAATVRWFEDRCTVDAEWSDECYLNHSFTPNALWHLGFVFALADLAPGIEVTVDYRLLLDEGATPGFDDAVTGMPIIGFSWQESLRRSTGLLQEMMSAASQPEMRYA